MNVNLALKPYKNAIVQSCCKNGCKLDTYGLSNIAILDMDNMPALAVDNISNDVRADCLVFHLAGGNLSVGICEMKGRDQKASKIVEQLCAGVGLALIVCRNHFPKMRHTIIPILLAKNYKSSAYTILSKSKINIEGRKQPIRLHKCSDKFQQILKKDQFSRARN